MSLGIQGGGLAGRRFAPPSVRVVVVGREPGSVPRPALSSDPWVRAGGGCGWSRWHRAGCGEKSVWCMFAV